MLALDAFLRILGPPPCFVGGESPRRQRNAPRYGARRNE